MTRVTQIVTAGFYSGTLELQCTRIPIHQLLPNQSIAFRLTTTILAGLSGVRTSTIAGALGDGDEEAVSVGIAGRTPPCQTAPPANQLSACQFRPISHLPCVSTGSRHCILLSCIASQCFVPIHLCVLFMFFIFYLFVPIHLCSQ